MADLDLVVETRSVMLRRIHNFSMIWAGVRLIWNLYATPLNGVGRKNCLSGDGLSIRFCFLADQPRFAR
jgi:hypothetical protein